MMMPLCLSTCGMIVPDRDVKKTAALTLLSVFALCWWKRHVTKDFFRWLKLRYGPNTFDEEFAKDVAAGRDCIARCSNSSWWEWDSGSRPLFWRWPEEYRRVIEMGYLHGLRAQCQGIWFHTGRKRIPFCTKLSPQN